MVPLASSESATPATIIAAMSDADIKAEIERVIAQYPPQYESRTEADLYRRIRCLLLDPWLKRGSITPKQVTCYGCRKKIQLDDRRDFYSNNWTKHRDKCPPCQLLKDRGYALALPVEWHVVKRRVRITRKKQNQGVKDSVQKRKVDEKLAGMGSSCTKTYTTVGSPQDSPPKVAVKRVTLLVPEPKSPAQDDPRLCNNSESLSNHHPTFPVALMGQVLPARWSRKESLISFAGSLEDLPAKWSRKGSCISSAMTEESLTNE